MAFHCEFGNDFNRDFSICVGAAPAPGKQRRIPIERLREILESQGNPWAKELVDAVEAPPRSAKHREIVDEIIEEISKPIVPTVDWSSVAISLHAAQTATRSTLALKHAQAALEAFRAALRAEADDEEAILLLME